MIRPKLEIDLSFSSSSFFFFFTMVTNRIAHFHEQSFLFLRPSISIPSLTDPPVTKFHLYQVYIQGLFNMFLLISYVGKKKKFCFKQIKSNGPFKSVRALSHSHSLSLYLYLSLYISFFSFPSIKLRTPKNHQTSVLVNLAICLR